MPDMLPFIPEDVLEGWLAQWEPNAAQSYPVRRAPKCWGCGRTIKMQAVWHIFFRKQQREAHVCDSCAEPYMTGPICSVQGDQVTWHIKPTVEQMQKVIAKIKDGLFG